MMRSWPCRPPTAVEPGRHAPFPYVSLHTRRLPREDILEIELRQILRWLRNWWWVPIAGALLGGLLGFGYAKTQPNQYEATAQMIVNPQTASGSADPDAIAASRSQASTFQSLVKSGPVLDAVIKELGLSETRQDLFDQVTVTVVPNTQIIQVTARDDNPQQAADIATSMVNQFELRVSDLTLGNLREQLKNLQDQSASLQTRQREIDARLDDTDTPENKDNADAQAEIARLQDERREVSQTLADLDSSIRSINQQLATSASPVEVADPATVPNDPVSPRPVLMALAGFVLGGILAGALSIVLEVRDDRIRRFDDIGEMTRLRVLGNLGRGTAEADRIRTHLGSFLAPGAHRMLALASPDRSADANDVAERLVAAAQRASTDTQLVQISESASSDANIPAMDSSSFGNWAASARSRHDAVVVTTGPADVSADALVAAGKSDVTVIVVNPDKASWSALQSLVDDLRSDGANIAGIVLAPT